MMLAIMMANAGGAWDNAKKYIEIEGNSYFLLSSSPLLLLFLNII